MDCDKFKAMIPDAVFTELDGLFEKFGLTNELRLAHFMAQCAHESGNFLRTEENLNYSADRLLRVFPKYFDRDKARKYAHDEVKIASRVYANRMGNGGENSQDGWKYRGRGYIQLTGRDNYAAFDLLVPESLIAAPHYVSTKYPLLSAAWFWDTKKLNEYADIDDIETITRKINGGLHGLDSRKKLFDKFYEVINA